MYLQNRCRAARKAFPEKEKALSPVPEWVRGLSRSWGRFLHLNQHHMANGTICEGEGRFSHCNPGFQRTAGTGNSQLVCQYKSAVCGKRPLLNVGIITGLDLFLLFSGEFPGRPDHRISGLLENQHIRSIQRIFLIGLNRFQFADNGQSIGPLCKCVNLQHCKQHDQQKHHR